MAPGQITLYVGLGIVIFGAVLWLFNRGDTGENTIDFLGLKLTSSSPTLVVMAIGVVLVIASQSIPSFQEKPTSPRKHNVEATKPDDPIAPPEAADTRVNRFTIMVRIGASGPLRRDWKRVTPDRWVEAYPEGNSSYFSVVKRTLVDGCSGTVAEDQANPSHRVFIPDKGCKGMPFLINDANRGWGVAAVMTEVQ